MKVFPYSKEQIDRIFNDSNRKGLLRRDWFKIGNEKTANEYFECVESLKKSNKKYDKETDESKRESYQVEIEEKRSLREDLEQLIKEEILEIIYKKDFFIKLTHRPFNEDEQKILFETDDRESFFAAKIITDELRKIYKIEMPEKNEILKTLILLLNERMNKFMIRGDIKSFFESVPRENIIEKIVKDSIITPKSVRLLNKMSYSLKMDFRYLGIPRGISFSSDLTEIYMREADEKIRNIPGVFFYKRYVDDIMILASHYTVNDVKSIFNKVNDILGGFGLKLHTADDNSNKYYAEYLNYDSGVDFTITYLGYKMIMESNRLSILLSDNKMERYKRYIDIAFDYYLHHASSNPRKRETERCSWEQPLFRFFLLMKYMTCNYHLGGTKREILSGVYFKHSFLNDLHQLRELDDYLTAKMEKCLIPSNFSPKFIQNQPSICDAIKRKIRSEYSFEKGFTERKMVKLTSADFNIVNQIIHDGGKERKEEN